MATHQPTTWESRVALGRPDEIAAALAGYAAVGFRHPILVFRSPWDLETIDRLGEIREELIARRLTRRPPRRRAQTPVLIITCLTNV